MKIKKSTITTWGELTNEQKINIEISSQQLNEGKGIPIKKAMAKLTKKYALSPKAK